MSRLYNILDAIITRTKEETITPNITKSSGGNLSYITGQRIGGICLLQFRVTHTTAVAAGGDFFRGTLDNYRPQGTVYAAAYYERYPIMASVTPSGVIVVRNTGGASITISSGIGLSFIYMLSE